MCVVIWNTLLKYGLPAIKYTKRKLIELEDFSAICIIRTKFYISDNSHIIPIADVLYSPKVASGSVHSHELLSNIGLRIPVSSLRHL